MDIGGSQVLIEQARGVLLQCHGLDDRGVTRMRRQTTGTSRKPIDVAREVITTC